MVSRQQVARSKAIQRHTGRTFYLATLFLPQRTRRATHALYGFFRVADEVVDRKDPGPPAEQRERLQAIREAVLGSGTPADPVLAAFCDVADEYDIPDAEVELFLDAMAADVDTRRYETYADLEAYMRGSSVSVANMMVSVMQPSSPERAAPHAAALGEAFQLTNFLRDVREDIVDRDRIYLPLDVLARHGVTEDQLATLEMSDGFAAAMREALRCTENRYRQGVAGIATLPRDCQFPVLLAAVLYADYHRAIRDCGYDVLGNEPTLSSTRKLSLAVRTGLRWHRSEDPESVFYGVSPVEPPPTASPGSAFA